MLYYRIGHLDSVSCVIYFTMNNFHKSNDKSRKANTLQVKEAIEALLDAYKLKGKYYSSQVVEFWPKLMGAPIASRTKKIYTRDKKLYVYLDSAPLRQELLLSKSKIIQLFEEHVGQGVIEELILR